MTHEAQAANDLQAVKELEQILELLFNAGLTTRTPVSRMTADDLVDGE